VVVVYVHRDLSVWICNFKIRIYCFEYQTTKGCIYFEGVFQTWNKRSHVARIDCSYSWPITWTFQRTPMS
jgi:hypothetical protein